MMAAIIIFFLFGLMLAFIANKLVISLTSFEEPVTENEQAEVPPEKPLPWHKNGWPDWVRWGVLTLLPPSMGVAAARFDLVQAAAVSLLLAALLVCTATDLLRFRVPNVITYPAILLALAAAAIMPDADLVSALLAALVAGLAFVLLDFLTRGGIGLGDVKLAILIGAMLGLPAAYQSLALGVIAAGVVILPLFLTGVVGRKQAVPYAPFLALSAIVVALVQGTAFAPL